MQAEAIPHFSAVNDYADFSIATTSVPAANRYLTIVMRDGLPFDFATAETLDKAQETHEAFLFAAMLYNSIGG